MQRRTKANEYQSALRKGRPKKPRLQEHGKHLKQLAEAKYDRLVDFYCALEKFYIARRWGNTAVKRTFQKAFTGSGPFGTKAQIAFDELVGLPLQIKRFLGLSPDSGGQHMAQKPKKRQRNQPNKMLILHSYRELHKNQVEVVQRAKDEVCAMGSRTWDELYLRSIERRLKNEMTFVYYRVLFGPPKTKVLKDHLKRIAEQKYFDRNSEGRVCIRIGVHVDHNEMEFNLVATDKTAIILLPCKEPPASFDSALRIDDPGYASHYMRFVRSTYLQSQMIYSAKDLLVKINGKHW